MNKNGRFLSEQLSIGEPLRGRPDLHELARDREEARRRLAYYADSGLGDDSALRECAAAGHLPDNVIRLLLAGLELRNLSDPVHEVDGAPISEAYRALRDDLRSVARLIVAEDWAELPENAVSESGAFTEVDDRLAVLEYRARTAEEIIENAGYRFDPVTGRLEAGPGSSGGRPRRFLRDFVEGLLRLRGRERNDRELREWLAEELAPFFPPEILDTNPDGVLKQTVDNVYRDLDD